VLLKLKLGAACCCMFPMPELCAPPNGFTFCVAGAVCAGAPPNWNGVELLVLWGAEGAPNWNGVVLELGADCWGWLDCPNWNGLLLVAVVGAVLPKLKFGAAVELPASGVNIDISPDF